MNSIDKNQPEDNQQNLSGREALARIQEMAEDAKTCFFCTSGATGECGGARPMSIEKADADGTLWFVSAADSHKNQEIADDPRVWLFLQGATHSGFLSLSGTATISRDRAKIDELWSPLMKTWFTKGKDDPRITVIKVKPMAGYYWDTKHGGFVAAAKMMIGASIGKTLDDSISGQLRP